MLTLAVDTSTITASCAVAENGRILSELNIQYGKTHSQKIIPMIKTVLKMIEKDFTDIDLYAASTGPGSFTGLRIGVVTVKAMAYAHNKPVCAVPTLDALAFSMPDFKGVITPMMDARNNQVYTALYKKENNQLQKLIPEAGIHIDEWIEELINQNEDVLVLGDAAPLHLNRMQEILKDRLVSASSQLSFSRASAVALLAEHAYSDNKSMDAFDLTPFYLRKSQAERMQELKSKI